MADASNVSNSLERNLTSSENDVISVNTEKASGDVIEVRFETLTNDIIKTRSLEARARGKSIFKSCYKSRPVMLQPPVLSEFGGKEKFLSIFHQFYELLLSDPFTNVLFDLSHEDTNVAAKDHGNRLGLALLLRLNRDPGYIKLRGALVFENIDNAHKRAKNCPMRGKLRGKGFTYQQVYIWLGYLLISTEYVGIRAETGLRLVEHLASGPLHAYAPFHKD